MEMVPEAFRVPLVNTTKASLLSLPLIDDRFKLLQFRVPVLMAMFLATLFVLLFMLTSPETDRVYAAPNVNAVTAFPVAIPKLPMEFVGDMFRLTLCPLRIVTLPAPVDTPGKSPSSQFTQVLPLYFCQVV
jgi:hypothetical protein